MNMSSKSKTSVFRSQSGTSAIEFAIVAPVLLFMMFGVCAYGIFFGAVHSVQHLASNSARAALAGLDLSERQALVDQHVNAALRQGGLLQREALEVEVVPVEDEASFLRVTVAFDASELPIWNLYPGLPLPEKTIRREAVIRNGGY